MRQFVVAVCTALLVAGCGSRGETTQQEAAIEQRDLLQRAAEYAAKQAQQERLKEQMEQKQRRQAEEARKATEAEKAMIKSLTVTSMTVKSLTDPASLLRDPASPLSKRSIYYDFDAYNIKDELHSLVEAHSNFLVEHKDFKIVIEGNCDERGSREYNLALGQRRADWVKKAMTLLGVPANRIQTVSYGSEKPKALEHDEEAWAENRRSDIVYSGIDAPR
jgi:peptidoglycan-associated lipoprotein